MSKFQDNFSSESFYPDSNYYLDQDNSPEEGPISKDQKSNMGGNFEWPNTIGLLLKEQMEGLQ